MIASMRAKSTTLSLTQLTDTRRLKNTDTTNQNTNYKLPRVMLLINADIKYHHAIDAGKTNHNHTKTKHTNYPHLLRQLWPD